MPVTSPEPGLRITSRRYLGSKTDLVPAIRTIVQAAVGPITTFVDAFAGTGAVAAGFNTATTAILANDLLAANAICLSAFLETRYPADLAAAAARIDELNALDPEAPAWRDDYVAAHFGGTYFTIENARRIGAIRNRIEQLPGSAQLRRILLASLLYATDKVANTCGHYDAYRKQLDPTVRLTLKLPAIDVAANRGNRVTQQDANVLCDGLVCDVLFLDPPYNSRQYADTYHVLENLARWEQPPVYGKAAKFDRGALKSRYSTRSATAALAALLAHSRARFIVLTYNSMGRQGDPRSNALISDADLQALLGECGPLTVHTIDHRLFSAGKSEYPTNAERVFLCENRRATARRA